MDHSLSRAISAICIVVLLPSKQSSGSAAKIGVQLSLGRKRGLKQQINEASASRYLRLH